MMLKMNFNGKNPSGTHLEGSAQLGRVVYPRMFDTLLVCRQVTVLLMLNVARGDDKLKVYRTCGGKPPFPTALCLKLVLLSGQMILELLDAPYQSRCADLLGQRSK